MSSEPAAEIRAILDHYDLGELVDYERNTRGFVNTSYAIITSREGQQARYFLRRYNRGIREEELLFEHSLIDHLIGRQFECVARIQKARDGRTYLHRQAAGQDDPGEFVAIFEFLTGEDRYTWVSPMCGDTETVQAAMFLARFHSAVSGFEPSGRRSEAKILDLLPTIAQNIASSKQRSKHSAFDELLEASSGELLASLENLLRRLEAHGCARLPQLVIHCDYHPGNLKFQDGEIVGLFDFDWSKIDLRLFDLALAVWYFCTSWDGETDGQLRTGQAALFLEIYQATLRRTPGIGPLSQAELRAFPEMVAASNLYILNWAVEDYYQKEVDLAEYLGYLKHGLRFVKWFDSQADRDRWAWLGTQEDLESAQE